jgi:phospholipase/lecithinase/hemolysin
MHLRSAVMKWGVAIAVCLLETEASAFSRVVAFGDSLSDNGNFFARIDGLAPAEPYQNGRFSDGPVAVEVLAQQLGVPLEDHAMGGALTGMDNLFQSYYPTFAQTGMAAQVSQFLLHKTINAEQVDSQALYFLWGGSNDIQKSINERPLAALSSVVTLGVGNLLREVTSLYQAGARDFLVPLMPDLGTTYYGTSGLVPDFLLTSISTTFNNDLRARLDALALANQDINITIFDTPSFAATVRADIAAAGGNVTGVCWTGSYTGKLAWAPLCEDSSKFFLFDSVHPTGYVHQLMGSAMASSVSIPTAPAAVVPEPGSLALVVAGLVVLSSRQMRSLKSSQQASSV